MCMCDFIPVGGGRGVGLKSRCSYFIIATPGMWTAVPTLVQAKLKLVWLRKIIF